MKYPLYIRKKVLARLLFGQEVYEKGDELNFRCPICGDSKKDLSKRRGWYNLEKDAYFCFNCNSSGNFNTLVKALVPNSDDIFQLINNIVLSSNDLLLETVSISANPIPEVIIQKVKTTYNSFLKNSCKLIEEGKDIPAPIISKWKDRWLDKTKYPFYWCFDQETRFYDRIIIPFFDDDGNCIYFQARSITGPDKWKYLNPKGDKDVLFGFDRVNSSKIVPILEGPIKSLFVENAIAIMTTHISAEQERLLKSRLSRYVIMFDNDIPGIKAALKYAQKGWKIFIYPNDWPFNSDVDDYIRQKGEPLILPLSFVEENIYDSVAAIIKLTLKLRDINSQFIS